VQNVPVRLLEQPDDVGVNPTDSLTLVGPVITIDILCVAGETYAGLPCRMTRIRRRRCFFGT
jgi:hypothetical protein